MLDRRTITIPYRGSVSFRHQPNDFPRAAVIIGRSFGPFSRSTSLQQSTFRRQKSIADDGDIINILESSKRHAGYHQVGGDNKFQIVTSRETTQPTAIDIINRDEDNIVGTKPQTRTPVSLAGTEEINARNKALIGNNNSTNRTTTRTNPPAVHAASQYKFLRRQYSMDQKQLAFGSSVVVNNLKWRRNRYDSVDVISGRGISKLAEEEEEVVQEDVIGKLKEEADEKILESSDNNGVNKDERTGTTIKPVDRDRNRINLNIVLHGDDDPEADGGESLHGIGNLLDIEKPRQNRQQGFTGRKVSDLKSIRSTTQQLLDPNKRRPPLVRAMSAPSQNRTNLKKGPQPRRRKILPAKEELSTANLRQTFTSVQIREDEDYSEREEDQKTNKVIPGDESIARKTSASKLRNRATTFTCDQIVTLVSLLDSGGSDSEREGSGEGNNNNQKKDESTTADKAPTLRKAGKSVSFQEHANQNYPAAKEFSLMFRRGSVAPLAAKIRAHRPPTAPPVSVFIRDIDTSDHSTSSAFRMARRPTVDTAKSGASGRGEDGKAGVTQDPEAMKTAKERECFKLFQKMTNRGISVSYDTILRGMLTPTELRLIQKQRDLEQAQIDAAEAAANEPVTKDKRN